jgi:hypothetical protein
MGNEEQQEGADPLPSTEEDPLSAAEKEAAHLERVVTTLESALSEQHDDEQWTRETQDAVYELLEDSTEMQGIGVGGVLCKEKLCRIDLDHAAKEDFELFRDGGLATLGRKLWRQDVAAAPEAAARRPDLLMPVNRYASR